MKALDFEPKKNCNDKQLTIATSSSTILNSAALFIKSSAILCET